MTRKEKKKLEKKQQNHKRMKSQFLICIYLFFDNDIGKLNLLNILKLQGLSKHYPKLTAVCLSPLSAYCRFDVKTNDLLQCRNSSNPKSE